MLLPLSVAAFHRFGPDQARTKRDDTRASLLQLLDDTADSTPPQLGGEQGEKTPKPRNVPAVPPPTQAVTVPLRVALVSHPWLNSVQMESGAVCRQSGGAILTNTQLTTVLASDVNSIIRCNGGRILINAQPYRHTIDLIRRNHRWMAINELDLEAYVASVVGAEMPSHWNPEALKAQAVAARSYALAHLARPADSHYHLGDTTRWQVFGGERSQTAATLEATRSTRGIILSYKGGIVESLYAANSTISAEAHGHLGASMSQHGAQALALQGLAYNDILGRYYRGASLARLRHDDG